MPLIDGIGDEVVQFGIAVVVLIVAVLAWLSTNARPDRYRTVVLMRSRGHHPVTVSIRARQVTRNPRPRNSVVQTPATNPNPSDVSQPTSDSSNQTNNRVIPLQEMDSIVDADMAMMDNNRLHFYRRVEGPVTAQNNEGHSGSTSEASESHEDPEQEPVSSDQIREMDSIVSAMEAELTDSNTRDTSANGTSSSAVTIDNAAISKTSKEESKTSASPKESPKEDVTASTTRSPTQAEPTNQRKILIKLKYINDTLKEVEGILDEPLKDFKCRHFSAELSSESRVRLIFNGRVLLDEAATLRACGLHDRAVVHCLVQPKRAGAQIQPQNDSDRSTTMHELVTEIIHPERYWDLENILMTLVSLALTIVWFFRCEYSNMFTASASVALFGLTVFYSVAIFGLYLSDTFHFERRPAAPQPVPAN